MKVYLLKNSSLADRPNVTGCSIACSSPLGVVAEGALLEKVDVNLSISYPFERMKK